MQANRARRQLLKWATVFSGAAMVGSQEALSNSIRAMPAITSFLLDEEQVTCDSVACSGINLTLQLFTQPDLALELQTPEGLRLVNQGVPSVVNGACDSWQLSGVSGQFGSRRIESVIPTTDIGSGRYEIFVSSFQSGPRTADISVNACGASVANQKTFNLQANTPVFFGFITIDASGFVTIGL